MYAIISSGGKQYKVAEGDRVTLDKLLFEVGETVEFSVLLLADKGNSRMKVGSPYLMESKVRASVIAHSRGDKITVVKYRRRKHYQKRMGHRQYHTVVKITEIL